jgi:hypothetical protein
MRWASPSQDPAKDLACFCNACRRLAAQDGLDLGRVARDLADASRDHAGRRRVIATLFGGHPSTPLGQFMSWRAARLSAAVGQVAEALAASGSEVALDVFSPSLAWTVGQSLADLAVHGAWVKAMTYLDAWGPSGMRFELDGYRRWLVEAGDPEPEAYLGSIIGFPALTRVSGIARDREVLQVEAGRLVGAVGRSRAVLGLDAVEMPGVLDIEDAVLKRRVADVRRRGVGLAPSWDLLAISPRRQEAIATAWSA